MCEEQSCCHICMACCCPVGSNQALVVQLGCMVYQAYLLQRCNMARMRLFSVFLALPSATVRIMATQQMQVRWAAAVENTCLKVGYAITNIPWNLLIMWC